MFCRAPLSPDASQGWAAGQAALGVIITAYHDKPDAAASLQRSMLAFWESMAAALLQPEQQLQEFAAFACGLHRQGRFL